MDQSQLFSGVIVPSLAILIPTVIAVWIAASERRAARRDRAAVRTEHLVDRAISALSGLTSERFGTTSWDRHLRALVGVANSLETVDDDRSRWLGKWLRAECFSVASPMIRRAMAVVRWIPGWRLLRVERRLPQAQQVVTWAHLTLGVVTEWSHRHIDDRLIGARVRAIRENEVLAGQEFEWHREVMSSPLIRRPGDTRARRGKVS